MNELRTALRTLATGIAIIGIVLTLALAAYDTAHAPDRWQPLYMETDQ